MQRLRGNERLWLLPLRSIVFFQGFRRTKSSTTRFAHGADFDAPRRLHLTASRPHPATKNARFAEGAAAAFKLSTWVWCENRMACANRVQAPGSHMPYRVSAETRLAPHSRCGDPRLRRVYFAICDGEILGCPSFARRGSGRMQNPHETGGLSRPCGFPGGFHVVADRSADAMSVFAALII